MHIYRYIHMYLHVCDHIYIYCHDSTCSYEREHCHPAEAMMEGILAHLIMSVNRLRVYGFRV